MSRFPPELVEKVARAISIAQVTWSYGAPTAEVEVLEGDRMAAKAALEAAIPPGWQLVPKEPTDKMLIASATLSLRYKERFAKMLAAAPSPWEK